MELTVIRLNEQLRSCSAQSHNEILVVFQLPKEHGIGLGDKLTIPEFRMDADVSIRHNPTEQTFHVFIRSDNVHDLRLPTQHSGSRTPSADRINDT